MVCRIAAAALAAAVIGAPAAAQIASEQDRREAIQHYRAGQELFQSEKFEDAADEFQKAIGKDHLLTLAYYSLGQSFMNLKRYPSAIKAFEGCLEAFKTLHGLAQENRFAVEKQRDDEIRELKDTARRLRQQGGPGTIQDLRATQIEQRVSDLEQQRTSVEGPFRAPAEVLLALGSAHFRNGDREAAEATWKSATQSNPKLGEAHNNLAVIYMQTGRLDEAEQEVKLAEKNGFKVNPQFKADLKEKRKGAR